MRSDVEPATAAKESEPIPSSAPMSLLLGVGAHSSQSLDARIARARDAAGRADQRVTSMKSYLEGIDRGDPNYGLLMRRLHLLERRSFNGQLELDALLRARRQL